MINQSFVSKCVAKYIAYIRVGKAEQAKAWLDAMVKHTDPTGEVQRATAGGLKPEDAELLADLGYYTKITKADKADNAAA